jgi:Arc/MetJ-type ribon-helix-helix transcriptional regulator
MTTLTIKFRGIQEEILEEMIQLGIAETKSEAVRMALLNFALISNMISKEKLLQEIRKKAKEIKLDEGEIQKLITDAKEKSIH